MMFGDRERHTKTTDLWKYCCLPEPCFEVSENCRDILHLRGCQLVLQHVVVVVVDGHGDAGGGVALGVQGALGGQRGLGLRLALALHENSRQRKVKRITYHQYSEDTYI